MYGLTEAGREWSPIVDANRVSPIPSLGSVLAPLSAMRETFRSGVLCLGVVSAEVSVAGVDTGLVGSSRTSRGIRLGESAKNLVPGDVVASSDEGRVLATSWCRTLSPGLNAAVVTSSSRLGWAGGWLDELAKGSLLLESDAGEKPLLSVLIGEVSVVADKTIRAGSTWGNCFPAVHS